jgi:tetratricopeptide (TPR) repeat protein
MSQMIFLLIILGTVLGALTYFLARSLLAPRSLDGLSKALEQGQTQQVIRRAKKLLKNNARDVDAHYSLALAYEQEEKHELALMELRIINRTGRFSAQCAEIPFRRRLAELSLKFGQHEEALTQYLLLIDKDPGNGEHYYRAGELFERRDMPEKALLYYRKAVELDGRHSGGHLKLGALLLKSDRPLAAKEELEICLKLDPDNCRAHFYLGRLLKSMHDYPGALRSLEKARRDPDLKVRALIETGMAYLSMNNLERAATTLQTAMKLAEPSQSQDFLYSRYFLSLCCERARDLDRAVALWQEIYARRPTFKDVAQKLSQYQDLREDDRLKDYLTAGSEDFLGICRRVLKVLKLEEREITEVKNGCTVLALEKEKNWTGSRKRAVQLMFLRVAERIDELTVRRFHELMKTGSAIRGMILTSSQFSSQAIDFAQSRPLDLLGRDELSSLLHKAG